MLAQSFAMRIVSKSPPTPRLLYTVAADPGATKSLSESPRGNFSLKGASLFSGNGRAIFIGIAVGASLFSIIGVVYVRHQAHTRQQEAASRAEASATQNVSPSPAAIVPVDATQIQVSAISLGEPRLAIVNGQQVTEGDRITVPTQPGAGRVTLRVVKISDGRIELSNGPQVISARLNAAGIRP